MGLFIDKTCKDTEYFTPERVLAPVRDYFGGTISLDPATDLLNPTRASYFFTKEKDGLGQDWTYYPSIFVNPPFGLVLKNWVKKIAEQAAEGCHIIALLPANRFETEYLQKHFMKPRLSALCFVRKRIAFENKTTGTKVSNPYGSVLYLFNGQAMRFGSSFHDLGKCLAPLWL